MKAKHKYGYDRFHWDADGDLIFEGRALVSLVPHENIPKHYRLKFCWRDSPTPEFFNIINAKENSMRIALYHINYDVWE